LGRMCSGGRVGRTRPGREGDKQRGDHQKCCRPRPILLPSTSTTCIRGLACVCKMHVLSSVAPLDLCLSLAAAMGPGQCLGGQSRGAGSEAHGRRPRLSASEPAPSCPVRHERSHKLVQRRRGPIGSIDPTEYSVSFTVASPRSARHSFATMSTGKKHSDPE
jgi:hypothetical protein